MRDLTKTRFNSNSPMKNYVNLNERIESIETKLFRIEQALMNAIVKINEQKLKH